MGSRKSVRDIAMNQPLEEFGSLCLLISESNISVPPTTEFISHLALLVSAFSLQSSFSRAHNLVHQFHSYILWGK